MLNKTRIAGMVLCVAILLSIAPMTSFAGSSYIDIAGEGGVITPYWTGVVRIYSDLICSGGKANPVIDVEVDSSKVDKVNFNVSLLQYKNNQWINIAGWDMDKPVSLNHSLFGESYSISHGYDYKFIATIKAYKGSALVDTINVESEIERY